MIDSGGKVGENYGQHDQRANAAVPTSKEGLAPMNVLPATQNTTTDFEFYETAEPFTRWLFAFMRENLSPIQGRCFEPCVGNGAIIRASNHEHWFTNDLDPRWPADVHKNAKDLTLWKAHECDWTVTNPPFTEAVPILSHALNFSRVGVAMYLRLSIHEPLKTGERRTFFADNKPTVTLVLPRFAHQRSRAKGIWSTDSMTSCWCVWLKGETRQFIDYAPESVIDELEAFTPGYRERMDALMGFTGTEAQRQAQCIARWKVAA
jgi:hypothetical protein